MKDETAYAGCFEIKKANSGTYDDPIILYAQRNADGTRGVKINCCSSGRQTCLNFEGANYIAVDGFELEGGKYGVRAVGLGYDADDHQKGIFVLDTEAYNNCADPFFTAASDWAVFEKNLGHHGGTCDGHGMYLSNGSDFNIVRYNELHSNKSSDFQINADPASCCVGANPSVAYSDEICHGLATDGLGRGASDYMHIEGNYFHNGLSQGPNFTSVRHSKVINNIIALYERHGTSFWQETSETALGSSDNIIEKNLFIGKNNRHVVQFVKHSTRNSFKDNIIIGLTLSGNTAVSNSSTALVNADGTVADNINENNFYVSGTFDNYTPNDQEIRVDEFDSSWFVNFPYDGMGRPGDWKLTDTAPHNKFNDWSPVDFDNLEEK